ncbi:MAG TPA: F0F1 ATP synthase subunit A, partial [Longimicrobiales bacterium]|nr:F0F1 ATP synthase subunit A [Longimicrobiales bacterium]
MTILPLLQGSEEAAQAAAGHSGSLSFSELPAFIREHLSDGPHVEFAGLQFDMGRLRIPPVHLGGLTIDLTPTRHVFFLVLAALLCVAVFVPIARAFRRKGTGEAPSGFANAVEAMIVYFRDEVVRRNIGHGGDRYTPLILTIFFFVLFMNLLGLTPLAVSATGNLSVTGALAIVSFVVIEVSGFLTLGTAGYARTIFYLPEGLPVVMKPIMLVIMAPVEFLGKLTKPFALAVRLFANMLAGHTLILALLGLIFVYRSYGVAGG